MEYIVRDARPVALFLASEPGERTYGNDIFKLKSAVNSFFADDGFLAEFRIPPCSENDVAMIVYTSGSSGKPKGYMLRNKSMVYRGQIQIRDCFSGEHPILYNPFPMKHVGGLQLLSAYSCVAGGTVVFQRSFEPGDRTKFSRGSAAGPIDNVLIARSR
jgi:long-subunit acyl-CoA synthetase (AMP-forming)